MKKISLLTTAAALGLAVSANAALVLDQTGLVAHYDFEGADQAEQLSNKATNDPTGQNYGITISATGISLPNAGPTFSENFAFSNGGGSRLNTTYSNTELGTSYTIGGYFYYPSTETARSYAFEAENNFDLSLGDNGTRPANATDFDMLPYSDGTSGTSTQVSTNQWVQLAVVVDGDTVSYFKDGVQFDTGLGGTGSTFNGMNFLNARNGQNRGAISGVDEIFIYNRALTATDLQAIPEPSSTILIGLAGIGLILRRRR